MTDKTPTPADTNTDPATQGLPEGAPDLDGTGGLDTQAAIDAASDAAIERQLADLERQAAGEPPPDGDGQSAAATPDEGATPPADNGQSGTAPAKAPEPTVEELIAKARAEAKTEAMREAAGRFGGEKQQALARIAELEAQLGESNRQRKQPSAFDPDAPVTDEDRIAVGGENWKDDYSTEDIDREVRERRRSVAHFAQPIIDAAMNASQSTVAEERREAELFAAVDAEVPAAHDLDANAETNGFREYLDERMPGTASTRREEVDRAIRRARLGIPGALEVAKDVLASCYKGYLSGMSSSGQKPATTTTTAPAAQPAVVMPKLPSAAGVSAPKQGKYTLDQVKAYLGKAAAKGDEVYNRAQAWVLEQSAAGNIVE